MKRSLLEMYALAVCLFSIGCFSIYLGLALFSGVALVNPALTHNGDLSYYESNERFIIRHCNYTAEPETCEKSLERESEEALAQRRLNTLEAELEDERHDARRDLLSYAIALLVSGALFLFHWRIARRARERA